MKKKRIALFHPWIKSKGGAERLILEFAKNSKHDVDFFTWIYDKENTFEDFSRFSVEELSTKIGKRLSRKKLLRGLYFSLFGHKKRIGLDEYDLFLVSTSGVAERIVLKNKIPKKTIAYVHTPLRDVTKEDISWNLKKKNFFSKLVYLPSVYFYKSIEKKPWKFFDKLIFNSSLSLDRANERDLLGSKPFFIINPPIDPKFVKRAKNKRDNYFLYVSRINNKKRQDLLIRAWKDFIKNKQNKKFSLIIAGDIEDEKYYKRITNLAKETENVKIISSVNDQKIKSLIQNCFAFVYVPFREDFGMLPFEVLSMGKPLIASDVGGYTDILKPNKHFIPITEEIEETETQRNISRALTKFVRNPNKKFGKENFVHLSSKNFAKKMDKILDEL